MDVCPKLNPAPIVLRRKDDPHGRFVRCHLFGDTQAQ